jgi:hypothetical protein
MLDSRGTSFFGPWPGSPRNRFWRRHDTLAFCLNSFYPAAVARRLKFPAVTRCLTRKIFCFSDFCCTQFLLYCTLREFFFDRKLCTSVKIVESTLRSSVRDCIYMKRPMVHPACPRCWHDYMYSILAEISMFHWAKAFIRYVFSITTEKI